MICATKAEKTSRKVNSKYFGFQDMGVREPVEHMAIFIRFSS